MLRMTPTKHDSKGEREKKYSDMTKKKVYKIAKELGVSGRSKMNKAELIKAVKKAENKKKREEGSLQKILNKALKGSVSRKKLKEELIKQGSKDLKYLKKHPEEADAYREKWFKHVQEVVREGGEEVAWLLDQDFWDEVEEKATFLDEDSWIEDHQEELNKVVKQFKRIRVKGKGGETITLPAISSFTTKADLILHLLKAKGKTSLKQISKILKEDYNVIEEWCEEMSEEGLVELKYPLIGRAYVKPR